jgi:hypothetical protein
MSSFAKTTIMNRDEKKVGLIVSIWQTKKGNIVEVSRDVWTCMDSVVLINKKNQ